jgi:hypothetical protein
VTDPHWYAAITGPQTTHPGQLLSTLGGRPIVTTERTDWDGFAFQIVDLGQHPAPPRISPYIPHPVLYSDWVDLGPGDDR